MGNDKIINKKPYYVILTGSKNNAGDYLIKHRALELFKVHRPDREIVDIDSWQERDDNLLELFNNSLAIILTGGPALRVNMYPSIYKVLGEIDDIIVPILTMAIGWKGSPGEWYQTYNYKLSKSTIKLLDRIENSGYQSSVRDFHTLNVLSHHGYNSFLMTGCAALYSTEHLESSINANNQINSVGFSLGVTFMKDPVTKKYMKDSILFLKKKLNSKYFKVAFHHSLDKDQFNQAYGKANEFHLEEHKEFANWLNSEDIDYEDISGSAENLIKFYNSIDFHIGYRVHAHIYMLSINKLSILISEDGRGRALNEVVDGVVLNDKYANFTSIRLKSDMSFLRRVKRKLNLVEPLVNQNDYLINDLNNVIDYEKMTSFNRLKRSRNSINSLFPIMKKFLTNLP